jgi:hypothetical protein
VAAGEGNSRNTASSMGQQPSAFQRRQHAGEIRPEPRRPSAQSGWLASSTVAAPIPWPSDAGGRHGGEADSAAHDARRWRGCAMSAPSLRTLSSLAAAHHAESPFGMTRRAGT